MSQVLGITTIGNEKCGTMDLEITRESWGDVVAQCREVWDSVCAAGLDVVFSVNLEQLSYNGSKWELHNYDAVHGRVLCAVYDDLGKGLNELRRAPKVRA